MRRASFAAISARSAADRERHTFNSVKKKPTMAMNTPAILARSPMWFSVFHCISGIQSVRRSYDAPSPYETFGRIDGSVKAHSRRNLLGGQRTGHQLRRRKHAVM